MAKLQDMFTQARRTQGGGGIGFLGKNKGEAKAHAAALVVEFPRVTAGNAEAAIKAGADGLIFAWSDNSEEQREALKKEIHAAKAANEQVITGLHITNGWDTLDRESFNQLKELGIQYVLLPFNAPVRLLALVTKEVEKVITVPIRKGEMYPLFIRNLSAYENISGILLDFEVSNAVGLLTIEESLQYRAVREALRFPAFVQINTDLDEAEAYALKALGVQAVIVNASKDDQATYQDIKNVRTVLEKIHQEEKDTPSLTRP